MKRIGIMGGTFNPIHKGHLALAKAAQKEFALDEIIFIPSGNPPHKAAAGVIDKELRLEMVKLAIWGKRKYSVSRIELDRPGFSYAVDTFRALKKKYGSRAKLFFIMGLDSINELLDWKKPLELFKLCSFIVFPRQKEDISSSQIRTKIRAGRPVGRVVPKRVEAFIKQKGLYK
ncbi:MAG: nicotinate-nucleotide adenylyltransferase [Candidatus Margulisiibacteriota bacterium]